MRISKIDSVAEVRIPEDMKGNSRIVFLGWFQRLLGHRYLIQGLVRRDFHARFAGSTLGVFWGIIHPLIQLALYWFVFSVVLKVRGSGGQGDFALWLVVGFLPWFFFSEVVSRAPEAVIEQTSLLKRMVFPSELLVVSHMFGACLTHLFSLGCVALVIGLSGGLSKTLFWVIPFGLFTAILSLGLGWGLAAINVFIRDVGQIIRVGLQLLFYATPIVYPLSMVPGKAQNWIALNPFADIVEGYRFAFLGHGQAPLPGLILLGGFSLGVLLLGGLLFRLLKPHFPDVL